jgi:hypothetical protein
MTYIPSRALIGTVRFSFYQNRYQTETISIGIGIYQKNQFGIDQNRYRSVITENWTDLPTYSLGIYHTEELFLQKEKKRTLVTFLYWKTIKKKISFDITFRSRAERCDPVPKEKKTRNGTLVTFPNQKKIKNFTPHPSTYSIPVPVRSTSSGGVSKIKKRKGTLVMFPNQKKIKENFSFNPSTYSISVPVWSPSPGVVLKKKKKENV